MWIQESRYILVSQEVQSVRILVDYKREEEDCQERQGSILTDLR